MQNKNIVYLPLLFYNLYNCIRMYILTGNMAHLIGATGKHPKELASVPYQLLVEYIDFSLQINVLTVF